jgi:hypothetical protein
MDILTSSQKERNKRKKTQNFLLSLGGPGGASTSVGYIYNHGYFNLLYVIKLPHFLSDVLSKELEGIYWLCYC